MLCLILVNSEIVIEITALTHPDYMFTTSSAPVAGQLSFIFKSELDF